MHENREFTVFIVDDDAPMRRLIRSFVESSGLQSELFSSADSFLDSYEASRSGCVVADVQMPGMTGVELQEALAASSKSMPVIIVTGYGTVELAVRAMKAQAVSVLEKPFQKDDLLTQIRLAMQIEQERRTAEAIRSEMSMRLRTLTRREHDVMSLVVGGLANKQIARRLYLSEKTVEAHRCHMMKKLGVVSVAEVVCLAMAAGEKCVEAFCATHGITRAR